MEKKIAPSERKAQEIDALLQGQLEAQSGEDLLRSRQELSYRFWYRGVMT